jgi:hypothetical protein
MQVLMDDIIQKYKISRLRMGVIFKMKGSLTIFSFLSFFTNLYKLIDPSKSDEMLRKTIFRLINIHLK